MKKLTLVLSMMLALVGLNANAAVYLVGDAPFGQGWDPSKGVEMTDNGDNTYSFTTTLDGSVYFCFAETLDASWDVFNGQYRYGPTTGNNQTVSPKTWTTTQKQGNGSGAYKFTGTGQEYTVTIDMNEMRFRVDGDVDQITYNSLTVSGTSNLFGSNWDPTDENNDMTLVGNLYVWEKKNVELAAGSFEFKVVANHDTNYGYSWPDQNYHQTVATKGIYDVKITFNPVTEAVNCELELLEELPDTGNHTYTVAGSSTTLFGSEWDPTDTNNDMSLVEGLYTWTKNNVELTAGEIQFKVVMDHDWNDGVNAWPELNYVANIQENGNYNVKITFNEETKDITFEATIVEEIDDFYTVAGSPESVFGAEWNANFAENNMTLGEDGIYTWTKSVEMTADLFVEFKVVKNANWQTCYPENNWEYTCPADGTYDLTITFNPETEAVTFNAVMQGEQPEMVYTVVGPESIFGSDWTPTDTNNDMVKGENGVYTWSKEDVTLYGNFEFKVVGNHDYAIYEWPIGMNNWVANVAEEGIYTIEITFDPEAADADRITCTLTKTGDVVPVEHTYTISGTENLFGSNWDPEDEANNMVKGEDGVYTWSKENVEFAAEETVEFKVVQDHAYTYSWPSNNYWWQCTEAGAYDVVITFDPAADVMEMITFTATPHPEYIRGDVDQNGVVGIADVTALISLLLNHGETNPACDCNLDNSVGISDVTALVNFLLNHQW